MLDVKNKKNGKESQNNEIEVTTKIKEERTFLCCNTIFPVVTTFQVTTKNFEVATRTVQKSIKVDFKNSHFGRPAVKNKIH